MCWSVDGGSSLVLQERDEKTEKILFAYSDRSRSSDPGALRIEISADLCGDPCGADLYDRQRHRKLRYLFFAAAGLVPLYVILTIARSHDVTYLNGIFEMKNAATPIFITQPYMYIANNYDNFDCLVKQLPAHSMGLKGMFPLWALSGLKFLKPVLVDWPIYVTKEELTTVTLFYDAYYDFGIAGVFSFIGTRSPVCVAFFEDLSGKKSGLVSVLFPGGSLFYALVLYNLVFQLTTWFYFAVTGAFGIFLEIKINGGNSYDIRKNETIYGKQFRDPCNVRGRKAHGGHLRKRECL